MNCKQGDIAFITSSDFDSNIGKIVRVVGPSIDDGLPDWACESVSGPLPCWLDNALVDMSIEFDCADADLRPIRDQPGADETLTWAGRPAELPADVIAEASCK